jgi:hypothetical protein
MRISAEHILPNLSSLLAVQGTIQFSLGVIAEAGLSYVGLGAQPPTPSWGRMLNEAQTLTALAPRLALFPGVADPLAGARPEFARRRLAPGTGAMSAAGGPLLKVDALSVSIGGTRILRQVSLEVSCGEILGLVGASGAGKSLTALGVVRLLPPHAAMTGSVYLRGIDLAAMSEAQLQGVRGRDIGMVFQEPMTALNPLMRIGDQVAETVRLHGSVRGRGGAGNGSRRRSMRRIARAPRARSSVTLMSCPAASGSGWRSPSPSHSRRRCSSPTSPPPRLTPVTQAEVLSLLRGLRARPRHGGDSGEP